MIYQGGAHRHRNCKWVSYITYFAAITLLKCLLQQRQKFSRDQVLKNLDHKKLEIALRLPNKSF